MCIGTPRQLVEVVGNRGRDASGHDIDLALVQGTVSAGSWVLVHVDTAISVLDGDEALAIRDALQAAELAAAGLAFEHLLQDLIDREPELPAHLRDEGAIP